jgi:signal transduction histidine kinase
MRLVHSDEAEQAALEAQFAQVQEITTAFEDSEAIEEMRNLLSDGLHGIEQIRDMVINLKDFSRLDRAKVMDFSVNDGVKSTLKIARNLVKHRDIRTVLNDVPTVQCAPSQINQVLLNLITNACHATADQGGRVGITTRAAPDGVLIEVTDNGCGIPASVLPRIFDPFFTTKKVGEGTGLGLSIAQRIIHDHGGRIDVVSTVGVGSKFSVYLPVRMKAGNVDSVWQSEPKEPS